MGALWWVHAERHFFSNSQIYLAPVNGSSTMESKLSLHFFATVKFIWRPWMGAPWWVQVDPQICLAPKHGSSILSPSGLANSFSTHKRELHHESKRRVKFINSFSAREWEWAPWLQADDNIRTAEPKSPIGEVQPSVQSNSAFGPHDQCDQDDHQHLSAWNC